MASSPLQAFDPLAKHYFTSHGTPAPPARNAHAHAHGASHPPPQASSVPSRPPMKAPQPVPAGSVKPIFTSFQKDRASPDLPDVKKKPAQSWGGASLSSPSSPSQSRKA